MNGLTTIQEKFTADIIETHAFRGDETIVVRPPALLMIAKYLKEVMQFDFLMDLTAVDYLFFAGGRIQKDFRFEVVYHFYSLKNNTRLRLKVAVDEKEPEVDSVTSLWSSADWYEREVWDMYGIRFKEHPNLKRILMYEEFKGHALRKDYPYNKRQPLIGPEN